MLWICAKVGTGMPRPLVILQRLPLSELEAGVSGVNKSLSLPHGVPHS